MSVDTWAHYNPVKILFGRGCRLALRELVVDKRILIVGSARGRQQFEADTLLRHSLEDVRRVFWIDTVEMNPDVTGVQHLIHEMQHVEVDSVVAFGGGSAIDTAKALAVALSPSAGRKSLRELLSIAGTLPAHISLPLYALPTTAGTGSEVTPYATIWDRVARQKLSLSGPVVYPDVAVVDPELSDTVPYSSTLNTGLDAINQAAESIWNRNMTPWTEVIALRALKMGMATLPELLNAPQNPHLRDTMAEASLLSGLAISQTRTSLCHSISYPITAHFGVPHGLACAFTMPAVLRHSLESDDGRFLRMAKVLLSGGAVSSESLVEKLYHFNQTLNVAQRVREIVGPADALLALCHEMVTSGRADNSLFEVNLETVSEIIASSFAENY